MILYSTKEQLYCTAYDCMILYSTKEQLYCTVLHTACHGMMYTVKGEEMTLLWCLIIVELVGVPCWLKVLLSQTPW